MSAEWFIPVATMERLDDSVARLLAESTVEHPRGERDDNLSGPVLTPAEWRARNGVAA